MATALRIYCAERIRAMQLVCMCAFSTCTAFFTECLCLERHEVQVSINRAFMGQLCAVLC